jgi:hypothetical protein
MTACPRCAHAAPEDARFCPACGGRRGEPSRGGGRSIWRRRTGLAAGAETHLAAARGLFREMGMTFWVERMEADGEGTISAAPDF